MRKIDCTATPFIDDPRFAGAVAGVHLAPPEDPALHAYVIAFAPGARTAWHAHENGQLLICTAGRGLVVTRDGALCELTPSVSVWTDAGEEHWHGATADSSMTHVAVQTQTPGGGGATWAEHVPRDR